MRFSPRPGSAIWVLSGATALAGLAAAAAIWGGLQVSPGPVAFLLFLLALVALVLTGLGLAYTLSFRALTYHLDRNGLVIHAGLWQLTMPMDAIEGVYSPPEGIRERPFRGLRLSGHNVGVARSGEGVEVVFAASAPPEECLYVKVGTRAYAISPDDLEGFLRAFQAERQLSPLHPLPEGLQLPRWLQSLAWRDRLGMALTAATLLAALALVGLCFWRYPHLPPEIPMHFDALGRPDRMAAPRSIFYLPLAGATVLIFNYALAIPLYRYEKFLSYVLWAGAGVVQVILILALRSITG